MRPGKVTLRGVPVFQALEDRVLDEIDVISEVVIAEHGDQVCSQGQMPTMVYFILDGQVALSSTAPDGSTAVVEVLRRGGDLVLASVMASLPYVQSAYAVQSTRLLAIQAEGLRAIVEREPVLALSILRALSGGFRDLVRQIRDLKVRTTAQRLGCYLLALVPDPSASTAELRLPFEKGLLAARLGCRQENLSRAFAALRELGVETRGSRVNLGDIPRLTAYSMPDYLTDPELGKQAKAKPTRVNAPASA